MGEFFLGTDPEAVIVTRTQRKIRTAKDIISDPDPHSQKSELGANAIGLDGNRDTSSIEFRPGIAKTGEELVNRLATLCSRLHRHYHPRNILYQAGAYVAPEPLGGHIHVSWTGIEHPSIKAWYVSEMIQGLAAMSNYLVPKMFNPTECQLRKEYAKQNNRDFASPESIRPKGIELASVENHFEYRYPPSWLMTPEAAYCFLGGAETIVAEVLNSKIGQVRMWPEFVEKMYSNGGISPNKGMNLEEAYKIAVKHSQPYDFLDNWIEP